MNPAQLAREDPARLVRLFQQAERRSRRTPDDLLQKWKPDGTHHLGDLLEKAAEVYVDGHLPQWRENEGADGHLTIDIRQDPDGALVLDPRGHATVRTMTEVPMVFPKPEF